MKYATTTIMLASLALIVGCESSPNAEGEEAPMPETAETSQPAPVETLRYESTTVATPSPSSTTEVIYVEPETTSPGMTSEPVMTTEASTTTVATYEQPMPVDATTAPPVTDNAQPGGVYTIKKGDTLYSIARRVYGSGMKWRDIQAANPGIVPTKLRIGQQINLP